jgi:transposase-like protein
MASCSKIAFRSLVILLCVRRYLAFSLSLRNLEETSAGRSISADYATVYRWAVRYAADCVAGQDRSTGELAAVDHDPLWQTKPLESLA